MPLARGKTDIGRAAVDLPLDVIERADPIQRFAGDRGFRLFPFVMEVSPQMGPAGSLLQAGCSIRLRSEELGIAFIAVGLQDAAGLGQMAMDVFFLPVRGKGIDRAGRRCACPGALIPDIGPDPPLLNALAQPLVALRPVQHPDRRVIGMQQVAGHDVRLDPVDQRRQHLHGAAAPVDQGAVGDIGPHARKDFVLAIEGKVIVEFGDKDVGQKARTGHAARDRPTGGGHLHHALAAAAGFLQPGDLHDLQPRRDQIKHLADILAHHAQVTTAIRAAATRIKLPPFAWRAVRDPGTAARSTIDDLAGGSRFQGIIVLTVIHDRSPALCRGDQQILQRQFQLLNLAFDFFRRLAEDLLLQLRDA